MENKLTCKTCGCNWEEYGRQWKRNNRKYYDYFCSYCGSKKKPREVEVDIEKEADEFFGGYTHKKMYKKPDDTYDYNVSPKDFPIKKGDYENKNLLDELENGPWPKYTYENILLVGDIHEPWCLDGYLEFCSEIYYKYNCDHVIFLGDCLDNNYSSSYATNPDGMCAGGELSFAIKKLKNWSKVFPEADVCIGNHEERIMKQCFNNGLSKKWIRDFKDVLGVNWNFQTSFEYNNCLFRHGVNTKAAPKSGCEMMNVVQGHFHTEAYIHWNIGKGKKVFGMQVPCGISEDKYAFAYAKDFAKPAIGCSVLLEFGALPVIEMYN